MVASKQKKCGPLLLLALIRDFLEEPSANVISRSAARINPPFPADGGHIDLSTSVLLLVRLPTPSSLQLSSHCARARGEVCVRTHCSLFFPEDTSQESTMKPMYDKITTGTLFVALFYPWPVSFGCIAGGLVMLVGRVR